MSRRHAGKRAAGIAAVASPYVVYTCLRYAAAAAEAAVLLLVAAPLLVPPLTGWRLARRLGAALIAVAVRATGVAYLRSVPALPH